MINLMSHPFDKDSVVMRTFKSTVQPGKACSVIQRVNHGTREYESE